jgi:hypothetical protein
LLLLGFDHLSDRKAFVMAVYDVGPLFVRELGTLGIRLRSSNQLVGMAVQHVTLQYVREFYDLGYSNVSQAV